MLNKMWEWPSDRALRVLTFHQCLAFIFVVERKFNLTTMASYKSEDEEAAELANTYTQ